jgi:hypothetical protein
MSISALFFLTQTRYRVKIQLSSLVTALSGKLGGSVIQSDSSGFHLRNAYYRLKRPTTRTSVIKRNQAIVASQWRKISVAQRKTWYGVVLDGMSGFALYRFLNLNRQFLNITLLAVPPVFRGVQSVVILSFTVNYASQSMVISFAPVVPPNTYVRLFATQPVSQGKRLQKNKSVWFANLIPNRTSPINVIGEYKNLFGSIGRRGDKIFLFVDIIEQRTGEVSAKQSIYAVVV